MDDKKYVIASMRHTDSGSYAVCLWGASRSGYTPNLDEAGVYSAEDVKCYEGKKDDFPIELELAKSMSVEREYNYTGWEKGHFILYDEVFKNTFNLGKAHYKSPSDKQYFRFAK